MTVCKKITAPYIWCRPPKILAKNPHFFLDRVLVPTLLYGTHLIYSRTITFYDYCTTTNYVPAHKLSSTLFTNRPNA